MKKGTPWLLLLLLGLVPVTLSQGFCQTVPFRTFQIKVKGMVCAFCSQGVLKSFKKQNDVLEVAVDLDLEQTLVKLKYQSLLTEKDMIAIIEDSGLKVTHIKELTPASAP